MDVESAILLAGLVVSLSICWGCKEIAAAIKGLRK